MLTDIYDTNYYVMKCNYYIKFIKRVRLIRVLHVRNPVWNMTRQTRHGESWT